jgi:glycosyltransferase involved in cell wall biosynthesis
MSPTLSVVIACRNAETTLGVQLDALAREPRHAEWEILLCDNGSTDGTNALAESYRDRLPSLRIVDARRRRGPAFARNAGAAVSRARYLAFVDADDEIAPGWIETMLTALDSHVFVAGRFEATRLNSAAVLRTRPLQQSRGLQDSGIGPRLPHAGAGNMGIHRDVFDAVGGFDAELRCLEDTDFCWRVQLAGVPLVFVPAAVVHVRLRSTIRRMWRQGRDYGAATAELEHRYAGVTRADTPVGSSPAVADERSGPRGNPVLGLVRGVRTPGALIWRLGWHAGHRAWRPAADKHEQRTPQTA